MFRSPFVSPDFRVPPWRLRKISLGFLCALASITAFGAPAAIELPGERAFPESITSTKDGTLYIGSAGAGGVYRVLPRASSAQAWIMPGAFRSGAIFGVLADEHSNTLWACSNDLSFMGLPLPGSPAGSRLEAFDLRTGEGKASFDLPASPAMCNDIAIGKEGSVYVTETMASQVLRLPPGGDKLELWLADPMLRPPAHSGGLDGIAFGDDGNLYLGNNGSGELFRVEVTDGKAGKLVKLQTSRALMLPDAIRPLGHGRFLLIENTGRLDSMAVGGDVVAIDTVKDGFSVPTGAAVVGDTVWVSEGQLLYLFDPSKRGQKPSLPFRVYPVPLPK